MADKKQNTEETAAKDTQVSTAKAAPKPTDKQDYTLIRRASIGGKWREKGATVSLTEKGRQQFKQEGKIK